MFPNPILQTTTLGSWLNKLLKAAKSCEIKPGIGYRINKTSEGTTLAIDNSVTQRCPFQILPGSTWLDYVVSYGEVITTGDPLTITGLEVEQTISDGVDRFWFYIEMTETTAEIKTSATTLTWSSSLIPIGWVDTTVTDYGSITQILHDNIFNPCATG